MTFLLDGVVSDVRDEHVVEFGLTILSRSFYGADLGEVTVVAQFSGGGSGNASREITESGGLGDTFFGFAAPDGQSIVSVTFASIDGNAPPFADIGFITAPVPEPSVGALGACALGLLLGFKFARRRARIFHHAKPR